MYILYLYYTDGQLILYTNFQTWPTFNYFSKAANIDYNLLHIQGTMTDKTNLFLLSSDIRSEGSIAIVKIIDFDFLMIFHSTSLPESKNVF